MVEVQEEVESVVVEVLVDIELAQIMKLQHKHIQLKLEMVVQNKQVQMLQELMVKIQFLVQLHR